jgi:hypothetical protein
MTDFLTFRLDGFHIDNTRSIRNDTDVVATTLKVGDRLIGTQIKHMGDVNNGDHKVGLEFRFIPVDTPSTPISYNYQIDNAGNIDDASIDQKITTSNETAAGIIGGVGGGLLLTGAAPAMIIGGALLSVAGTIELFNLLFGFLTTSCDGPVVFDQIQAPRSDFDNSIPPFGGALTQTRPYFGVAAPSPCHSDSRYKATSTVVRFAPLGAFSGVGVVGVAGYSGADGFQHVIVATKDRKVTEIFFQGGADSSQTTIVASPDHDHSKDVTQTVFAGKQPGQDVLRQLNSDIVGVAGYSSSLDGFQHVIVATKDRNVTEIYFKGGGQPIGQDVLRQLNSDIVGVAGYSSSLDGFQHVIVATKDRNVTEIYFKGGGQPIGQGVLTQLTSDIVGVAGYSGADGFQHVIVATKDHNVTEIFFKGGGQPIGQHVLTQLNSDIVGVAGYSDADGFHHLNLAGSDGSVYDLFSKP